jgi:hypothetical protein
MQSYVRRLLAVAKNLFFIVDNYKNTHILYTTTHSHSQLHPSIDLLELLKLRKKHIHAVKYTQVTTILIIDIVGVQHIPYHANSMGPLVGSKMLLGAKGAKISDFTS